MGRDVRIPVFYGLRTTKVWTTKAHTSLRIRTIWSALLLFTYLNISFLNMLDDFTVFMVAFKIRQKSFSWCPVFNSLLFDMCRREKIVNLSQPGIEPRSLDLQANTLSRRCKSRLLSFKRQSRLIMFHIYCSSACMQNFSQNIEVLPNLNISPLTLRKRSKGWGKTFDTAMLIYRHSVIMVFSEGCEI